MKRNLVALAFGLLGMGVALGAWHLWQDHQNLHALINMVVAQQKSGK